ncbi:excisionase family DNA-binding protein [Micromonospora sp. NPDC047740]|uniref:excisionase family DNA-binding protein n=1 Tax=Micromonospora sp. NPDC047740 TaxID=3364254 RepID=UPI00371A674B
MLRVEEAARALGIGRSLTYDLIRSGRLRSFKVGSRRLIPAAAIDETINMLTEEAA